MIIDLKRSIDKWSNRSNDCWCPVLYSSQMILFDIFFRCADISWFQAVSNLPFFTASASTGLSDLFEERRCPMQSLQHLSSSFTLQLIFFLVSCSWYRWCFWTQTGAFSSFGHFLLPSIVKPFRGLLCNTSATSRRRRRRRRRRHWERAI